MLDPSHLLDALPHPIFVVDAQGLFLQANAYAEQFFEASFPVLQRKKLDHFLAVSSPLLALLSSVHEENRPVTEYRQALHVPRSATPERLVDVYATPLAKDGAILVMLVGCSNLEKIDRQMSHRHGARSASGLAAMLAHEIKNPLSGIRGAAQLLEASSNAADAPLARLIRDETDRIVRLIERMDVFESGAPLQREALNVHDLLDHARHIAQAGFARHVRFYEAYDPSLPPIYANRDQMVQVLLNLLKNAAEAIGAQARNGELHLGTAYRAGLKMAVVGSNQRMALPIEITVRDNGSGIDPDVMPHLYEPFVSGREGGTGLGLAIVAKIIGDHGGVVECESAPKATTFRLLLPAYEAST